jgi:MoaA/NifB/PqqE/SkfB family radical SAM enzyme
MDRELYRKKNSRDNLIEIAIIQYFNELSSYKIKLLDYENGCRINNLNSELNNEETKEKFKEITKPILSTWERKNAAETDFVKLENCYDCKDSDNCIGCYVFKYYINFELIA